MPLPDWPKMPQPYDVHRRATERDWEISNAKRWSNPPVGKAQYNPFLLDREGIAELELYCIENGQILTPMGEDRKQYNFYLDCRSYFNDDRVEIGYSEGDKVQYVYVKWSEKGYHGYPATKRYLRSKGASV